MGERPLLLSSSAGSTLIRLSHSSPLDRFKGSESATFGDFPSRLAHIVSQTLTNLQVKSIIYPTYDTRGSLSKAVEAFVDWLTTTCVELECKPDEKGGSRSGQGKGAGSVKVILCGHSMGGLVAVDAALEIAKSGGIQRGKLWPRVCGVIAYDTPVSVHVSLLY